MEDATKNWSTLSLPAQFPSRAVTSTTKKNAKLTLWPLVAATFFMVSGGTYGTEDIIHGAGYGKGILLLLLTPLLWSLPTAFMIGELPARSRPKVGITPGCGARWAISGASRRPGCRWSPHFRHGDLSHTVCGLSRRGWCVVRGRTSRMDGGAGCGDNLHADEYRRDSRGGHQLLFGCSSCCRRRLC